MASIAFLGTGNMGAGMAGCLIKAGHDLTVYNRTMEKTFPLAELGATAADTPRKQRKGRMRSSPWSATTRLQKPFG